jgi:hypothetical protein
MRQFSATIPSLSQTRRQTREHSGCTDFHCGCLYVHTLIYVYNAALYIYCGYMYIYSVLHKSKTCLRLDHQINTNHTMRSVTLHKISCTYIHFWKLVVFIDGFQTEATRGCGRVNTFSEVRSACLCLKLGKFLTRASRFVVGPLYRPATCLLLFVSKQLRAGIAQSV